MGPEALSISGAPQASTPNLDKFARSGVVTLMRMPEWFAQ